LLGAVGRCAGRQPPVHGGCLGFNRLPYRDSIFRIMGSEEAPDHFFRSVQASSGVPQCDGGSHGVDATLVRAVRRPGVSAYVIACEQQLRVGVVLGGFKFPK